MKRPTRHDALNLATVAELLRFMAYLVHAEATSARRDGVVVAEIAEAFDRDLDYVLSLAEILTNSGWTVLFHRKDVPVVRLGNSWPEVLQFVTEGV